MVKSGLASPLFLCKYPQENITIQRVVAKQADTLQQTARIRLAAGKGRSMRRKEEIEAYAENLFLPITQKHGFELVDVEYVREVGVWYLRCYIDKEGGITVDDCEVISRLLGEWLDKEDFIEDSYILEVSSPGIERPLFSLEDYRKFSGKKIKVRTRQEIVGQKRFTGLLLGAGEDGTVLLRLETGRGSDEDETVRIPFETITKGSLVYEEQDKQDKRRSS